MSRRIIELTAWLIGRIDADCVVNEITECGCSILLPINTQLPADEFKLLIMTPGNDDKVHCILDSVIRWHDESFTESHQKAGIQFLSVSDDHRDEINLLDRLLKKSHHPLIKCSLIPA